MNNNSNDFNKNTIQPFHTTRSVQRKRTKGSVLTLTEVAHVIVVSGLLDEPV